jgi:titin
VYKTKTATFENHVAKLMIAECVESTTGTYTCQATNGAGTVQTSCKLSVQDVPKIEVHESESSQMIRVRNQWKVKVTYKGYPKPTVSWQKDGQPLPTADKHVTVYNDDDDWSTTIAVYCVERSDTGVYTVTASNDAGTATCNLNLKVIGEWTVENTYF